MPPKKDPYSTPGMKMISLFAKFLFSRQNHSLIDLARALNCSKQTIMKIIEEINRSYGVEIEGYIDGRRRYYRMKKISNIMPVLAFTESELAVLQMCKVFAEHLLGYEQIREASQAIEKGQALLPEGKISTINHFASYPFGRIDYTPYQQIIADLLKAMKDKNVCRVSYKRILSDQVKSFYIKPFKLFSHKDSLYLTAKLARYPGEKYKEPEFDPTLAVHRIKEIEITIRKYEIPPNYNFNKEFDRNFGVIKDNNFEVEIDFSGWSAAYIQERVWSENQRITELESNKVRLKMSVSSSSELLSWVLFFGDEATLVSPDWLVNEIIAIVERMKNNYTN